MYGSVLEIYSAIDSMTISKLKSSKQTTLWDYIYIYSAISYQDFK